MASTVADILLLHAAADWEIDELCDEWTPESLIPPLTEEMQREPPILEGARFPCNQIDNSGQIAPLDEIIRPKEKYRFRVLLDESNSFGVLGHSGKGLSEYYRVPIEKIDIVTAAMGHALSAEGGFCTGTIYRLSSSGYVFSASLPPYLATAAISTIDVLEENPTLITKLRENIAVLWAGLSDLQGLEVASDPHSPIVFLRLKKSTRCLKSDLQLLEDIADRVLKEDSVFVVTSKKSPLDKCPLPVGIKLFVSAAHSESDIIRASESLKRVAASMLTNHG